MKQIQVGNLAWAPLDEDAPEADLDFDHALALIRAGNTIGATYALAVHSGASFKAAESRVARLTHLLHPADPATPDA